MQNKKQKACAKNNERWNTFNGRDRALYKLELILATTLATVDANNSVVNFKMYKLYNNSTVLGIYWKFLAGFFTASNSINQILPCFFFPGLADIFFRSVQIHFPLYPHIFCRKQWLLKGQM